VYAISAHPSTTAAMSARLTAREERRGFMAQEQPGNL
jgi:hypothetical protein